MDRKGLIPREKRGDEPGASRILPIKSSDSVGNHGSHLTPLKVGVREEYFGPQSSEGTTAAPLRLGYSSSFWDMSHLGTLVAENMFVGKKRHQIFVGVERLLNRGTINKMLHGYGLAVDVD